jgi:branched-chain amino acid transport system substrate-binding protein
MWISSRLAALSGVAAIAIAATSAQAADPIKIGVIAETSAISGVGIPNGAELAADEINKAGGVNGRMVQIVSYDDHNSASDAVRAFQRAAQQDKVAAVIASYISEVVLALEPWAGRLHMPMITPGAASNEITKRVHDDYDHMKYVFHGYLASTQIADVVCEAAKTLMVSDFKMKTSVVMSEDAAWTIPLDEEYLKCLPSAGLKVLDHIRFSPDTTDFTPIFNKIEGDKPDVIVTGISHVGVQPTVQWQQQQVPMPMYGVSSQATSMVPSAVFGVLNAFTISGILHPKSGSAASPWLGIQGRRVPSHVQSAAVRNASQPPACRTALCASTAPPLGA